MDSTIFNPAIPYLGALPSPLRPGNLIRISGSVPSSATCFSINLQNGNNTDHRSDIALHLSPVFSPPPRIVRNSLANHIWGPEESHGFQFPLSCDQGFEILILAESDSFKIAINGNHFAEFQYRLPLQNISFLAIDGDVIVNCIKFEGLTSSPMNQGSGEEIVKPLGFVIGSGTQSNIPPQPGRPVSQPGRPVSPYDTSSLPYPTNPTFGPAPAAYSPQSPASAYNPYPPSSNLGPTSPSNAYPTGRVSPFSPSGGNTYGPLPSSNISPQGYPPQSGGFPSQSGGYPPQSGGYPSQPAGYPSQPAGYPSQPAGYPSQPAGYPSQPAGYPSQPAGYPSQGMYPSQSTYPGQPGPYPGTQIIYPDQGKSKSGSGMNLGPIAAAGAAALAGVAGSTLMGGKHKKNKHGHGMPGMGAGPGALLGGVSSLLGGNKHGHSGSSPIPIGGAVAGGAAALAGAYMLSKSPMGKMMKPKKMKKLYKHKHKGGWGGRSSSSSSSSSD